MWTLRINNKTLEAAVRNAAFIEALFGWKMDIAISSDRLLFLDCDDKERLNDFLSFCRALCKEYGAEGIIFETPNGYHFILMKPLHRDEVQRFYRFLAKRKEICDKFAIDHVHVLATVRRGYTTLRLNQRRIAYFVQPNGDTIEKR